MLVLVRAGEAPDARARTLTCAQCKRRETCLPGGLPAEDLERVETMVHARRRIKRGERLFGAGDGFKCLYAIRSGFFKTSHADSRGLEQVTGFFMAGELIGMDGFGSGRQLACFLLDPSRRFGRRGYSRSRFVLRMTREDIGSYLGLKVETVSRLFSVFHRDGLLEVRNKQISIIDLEGLERVSARGG